jgi:hypothetical protein
MQAVSQRSYEGTDSYSCLIIKYKLRPHHCALFLYLVNKTDVTFTRYFGWILGVEHNPYIYCM